MCGDLNRTWVCSQIHRNSATTRPQGRRTRGRHDVPTASSPACTALRRFSVRQRDVPHHRNVRFYDTLLGDTFCLFADAVEDCGVVTRSISDRETWSLVSVVQTVSSSRGNVYDFFRNQWWLKWANVLSVPFIRTKAENYCSPISSNLASYRQLFYFVFYLHLLHSVVQR